ncbi:hypothetical protein BVRB_029630, partial [Beta vulgaris subsp. vulgaris]
MIRKIENTVPFAQ